MTLPPELHRQIFEIVAQSSSDPGAVRDAWQLRLVSRDVRDWLDRVLFKTLFIRNEDALKSLICILRRKSPNFISRVIKKVVLYHTCATGYSYEPYTRCREADPLFEMCIGITHFASQCVPLRETGILLPNFQHLTIMDHPDLSSLPSTITHLELLPNSMRELPYEHMPNLTHLALRKSYRITFGVAGAHVHHILNSCSTRLEMLVIVVGSPAFFQGFQRIVQPRVFVGLQMRWDQLQSGIDRWEMARKDTAEYMAGLKG